MLEIHRKSDDGLTRDIWEVSIGLSGAGPEAVVCCQVVSFLRQSKFSARSKQWVTVDFWYPCDGPTCRVPTVPFGFAAARRLDALPRLPEVDVLQAVQRRLTVLWPGGSK